ncbi:MAG: polyketide cyclase [Alphaproteobacteria bacterium]|nr:polyketide cyclase [Alphaproteobacteria bacterium]
MWVRTYSQVFKDIKKERVWQIWTDVNHWPKWHADLEYCKLEGAFAVGNYFMLKPKGVKAVKIELTHIEEDRKFTDCTSFFGAKMYDTHELEETKDGLRLINTLVMTGPLKFLWVKLVAQNVADSVPKEMEALVDLAKS